MSLYRQPGQVRRRRRLIAAAVVAAVAAIALVVVLAAGGDSAPTRVERAAAANDAAGRAMDGLELLLIEYGQAVRGGRVVAPTEFSAAQSDVTRARDALTSHADDVRAVDPAALGRVVPVLDAVRRDVDRRVDVARLRAEVGRAQQILADLRSRAAAVR
jgi:hypothetical protein